MLLCTQLQLTPRRVVMCVVCDFVALPQAHPLKPVSITAIMLPGGGGDAPPRHASLFKMHCLPTCVYTREKKTAKTNKTAARRANRIIEPPPTASSRLSSAGQSTIVPSHQSAAGNHTITPLLLIYLSFQTRPSVLQDAKILIFP